VQDAKDANDMVDVPEDIAKALKIKPGPVSGKTLDRITRTHDMLERLRQRADQAQHPAVKFSSTGIDRDTGEILKTITFADGSTRTEATGSYDKNYVAADKRIAERRAPTGRGTDGGQAGGQAGGKARGGRPLTPAQLADALTERAIREDTSGDIQNAIRNVDKFYQDDEDFQRPGIRLMVKGRLQKMARDPKYLDREKEERKRRLKAKAEGEPGNSGSSGSKTGKGLTASDYLNQLSKEE
jgi:hypothetical protein